MVESLRGKERAPVDCDSPQSSEKEEMVPKINLEARLAEMAAKSKKAPPARKDKPSTGAVPRKVPTATEHKSAASHARVTITKDERPPKRLREADPKLGATKGAGSEQQEVPEVEVLTKPFALALVNKEGKSVMNTDIVHDDPWLGLALLPSLALKNDLLQVPNKLEDNLHHCSSLIVKVSLQSRTPYFLFCIFFFFFSFALLSSCRSDSPCLGCMTKWWNSTARRRTTSRAEVVLEKVQIAESNAEQLKTKYERLKKDLIDWKKRSNQRLEQVKAEHAKALEDVQQEGYNAGFGEVGEAYTGGHSQASEKR